MSKHEDFYTPEQVDEQVDALLQARGMPLRDQRLASDVRSMLAHMDEDASSLQRVLHKLVVHDPAAQQSEKIIPIPDLLPPQQGKFGSTPKRRTSITRMKPILRVLSTLAAVLVVAALVGSMLLVLSASRQQSRTHVTHANTPVASATSSDEGQVISRFKVDYSTAAVWSPDGSRLAAATNYLTQLGLPQPIPVRVQSWDARTGQHVLNYPLSSKELLILNVAWSPDGTKLAVAGAWNIYIFDASTTQLLRIFPAPVIGLNGNGASPLSAKRATRSMALLSSTSALSVPNFSFTNVSWSPDGKELSAGFNGPQVVVYVWDANTGAVHKMLTGFGPLTQNGQITKVGWSPRGSLLAIQRDDPNNHLNTETQLWDTTTWQLVKEFANTTEMDWSPDGTRLALVDARENHGKDIRLVDVQTGHTVKQFAEVSSGEIDGEVHWSPDGTRLTLEGGDASPISISIWSATSGTLLYSFPDEFSTGNAAWSPDSKYLSSVEPDPVGGSSVVEYVLIWKA